MSILNKVFGYRDPLGQGQNLANQAYHQQQMIRAMDKQLGIQNMAGGAGALATGMVNTQLASNQLASNGAYAQWGQHLTPAQIRDKTRIHIASEVEKMAEEIGAPTLLHAVVLAIRTMEIPE